MDPYVLRRVRPIVGGLLDLSRVRQALLSVAQPGLAAVLALGALPSTRVLIVGVTAAACGYLAVFSLNDVLDRRSDEQALRRGKAEVTGYDIDTVGARHPLAGGTLATRWGVAWVATLAAVAVVLAWLLNPWCVAIFAASALLEVVYCSLRAVSWLKTFVSGAMVGLGALAGWVAVAPLDFGAAGVFIFLSAWEIAGRNIPNDLADVGADSAVGLTTVPTTFGQRLSARAVLGGAVCTAAFVPLLGLPPVSALASASSIGIMMIAPAIALVAGPSPELAGRYFNSASMVPALVLLFAVVEMVLGGRS